MTAALRAGSLRAYVMLAAAALIYGAVFTVNRFAADAGVPPLAYSFWQSFGAGVVLWGVLTLNHERLALSRQHLTGYMVIGVLVIGIPITLLTYIAPRLPAGVMTLVLALSPPFTFFLSVLTRLERFRLAGVLGLVCGFIGVVLVVAPGATPGSGAWKWFLLALVAPLLFAASNVAAAVLRPPAASSVAMGAGVLLGSSVVLLPVMLIAGQAWLPSGFDGGTIAALIAVGINAAFLVLFFEIIRTAGPTFFAQFNYLAVLAGVGWGALILGERLTVTFFAAMALMFAGVFLAGYRGRLA